MMVITKSLKEKKKVIEIKISVKGYFATFFVSRIKWLIYNQKKWNQKWSTLAFPVLIDQV